MTYPKPPKELTKPVIPSQKHPYIKKPLKNKKLNKHNNLTEYFYCLLLKVQTPHS